MQRFQSALCRQIYSDDNLWNAWRAVKAKNGQAGADGVSLAVFERNLFRHLKGIQKRFTSRTYRPGPAKVFDIKKPDGGKRPIVVLSVDDRVAERAVYQTVNTVVDPQLHPNAHAFRPGRSTQTAVEHLVRLAGKRSHWLGHVDISACFPSLGHGHLKRQLSRFVKQRDVRKMVGAFIDASGQHGRRPHTGVLQGGPLSPLLSNVYLDAFDRRIDALGVPFVRYADNIIFVGHEKEDIQCRQRVIGKALRRIDLGINEEKTIVSHLSRGVAVIGYLLLEAKDDPGTVLYRNLHPSQSGQDGGEGHPGEPVLAGPSPTLVSA